MTVTRLKNLRINRVAFVDEGANPDADILIFKGKNHPYVQGSSGRCMVCGRNCAKEPSQGASMTTKNTQPFDLSALADDVRKSVEDELAKVSALTAQVDTLTTQVEALQKTATPPAEKADEEDVLKGMPEDVRKRFEAQAQLITQQGETIAKMARASRERDAIAKAKDLPHLGAAQDLGVLMVEIADHCSEDVVKQLEQVLKAANARIDLTKELGHSAETGGTADTTEDEINKMAREIRKANPELTQEQAVTQVLTDNPTLYAKARFGG